MGCEQTICPGGCSGHGECVDKAGRFVCKCFEGWMGPECDLKVCPNMCSGNGMCFDGKCYCDHGWSGLDCSGRCPSTVEGKNCSGHGACLYGEGGGVCFCEPGYTG